MHNHNGKNGNWMGLIMMICCLAPILILLSFGSLNIGGGINWLIIVVIGILIISYFWFMRQKNSNTNIENKEDNVSDVHKDGHCH